MGGSIDLDVRKVRNSPMKVILKGGDQLYGCFWYGDNFYTKKAMTPEMWAVYNKHHADTLVERLK